MTLLLVGAVLMLCIGALVGASWTTQVMAGVSRRHATERRFLNESRQALEAAKQARGGPVHCDHCRRELSGSRWLVVVAAQADEEDDGT